MLAEKNEYLKETTKTVFRMSAEELVIKRCRDREDYYADLRSYQKAIAKCDRGEGCAVKREECAIGRKSCNNRSHGKTNKGNASEKYEIIQEVTCV